MKGEKAKRREGRKEEKRGREGIKTWKAGLLS